MKKWTKFISILILLFILFGQVNLIANELNNLELELQEQNINVSTSTPVFYGTVGINLKVGDKLDLSSAVFRIFAKDFYDGDLTQNIKVVSNNVNTSKAGTYYIKYSVTNSGGKMSQIQVPVVINQNQERTIKRKFYGAEDVWNMDLNSTDRGNYHDRQNFGLYVGNGASLKVRTINENLEITGELLNNDKETEGTFEITNDWSTVEVKCDSVPFIDTSDISKKIKYQNSQNEDYGLWNITKFTQAVNNSIYFANVFESKITNEQIDTISIPTYGCDKIEVYINPKSGDRASQDYIHVRTVENPLNGYTNIKLEEPIMIKGTKYVVAVKYTGTTVPVNTTTDASCFTYVSNKLTDNWKTLQILPIGIGSNGLEYRNIPPIICKSIYEKTDLPTLEININDIYEENSLVKPLDYFLYGDNEEEFFTQWNKSRNSYAVLENDRVTFLVPLKDKDEIIKKDTTDSNYFKTIKEVFDFYNDVFRMYDAYIGLEDYAKDRINQNIKTKYFVKANKNGSGLAYYSTTHTAYNGDSIQSYFNKCWMILHEIGHGYDGPFRYGDINLSEVINNIFAYNYEKKILKDGDYGWLGSVSSNEIKWNKIRKELSVTFNEIPNYTYTATDHYHIRLYAMLNILNKIGTENGMSTLYRNSRVDKYEGKDTGSANLIAESFSNASSFNVIPYLKSWNIEISENKKQEIDSKEYPIVYYLRDLVKTDYQATKIKNDLKLEGIYSLVTNEEIKKYNLQGTANIKLSTSDYNKLKGHKIILKSGKEVIKTAEITSTSTVISNIPIGVYDIGIVSECYAIECDYLIISENNTTSIDLSVNEIEDNIAPQLLTLKVTNPKTGMYKDGQELEIEATFSEIIKGKVPNLSLTFSGTKAKGIIGEGKISNYTIKWNYAITSGDNGKLRGSLSGGTLTDIVGNAWDVSIPTLGGYTIVADTKVSIGTVEYSTKTATNQNVIATISFDEDVTITNNGGKNIYEFSENGEFIFQYKDNAGNIGKTTAKVDWIDKISPIGTITYSTQELTNQNVIATISFDEDVTITNNGGKNIYEFTENKEFIFEYKDKAGNIGKKAAKVDWIDKTAPELSTLKVTSPKTGKYEEGKLIEIQATFNEEVVGIVPDLKLLFGGVEAKGKRSKGEIIDNIIKWSYTIVNGDNGELTGSLSGGNLTDIVGNEWEVSIPTLGGYTITADTNESIGKIEYSTTNITNKNVLATVTFDKDVTIINNNGKNAYEFTENGDFAFEYKDKTGKIGIIVAKVNWIDKVAPILSTLKVTIPKDGTYKKGEKIQVEASFSEEIVGTVPDLNLMFGGREAKGTIGKGEILNNNIIRWNYTIVNGDNGGLTGITSGGELKDIVGNQWNKEKVYLEENNIIADTIVEFEIKGNPDIHTNKDITLQVDCEEELSSITVNGTTINGETFTVMDNGKYVFIVKDKIGNISSKTIIVDKIDKIPPEIILNYEGTLTIKEGENIQVNVTIKEEKAKIAYSWNNEDFIETMEYVSNLNIDKKDLKIGTHKLYIKAVDELGNESEVKSLEIKVLPKEYIKVPQIIFDDLETIEINQNKYVKVPVNMKLEEITSKMNKEALCGYVPIYSNLTEKNKIKTGSKILLNEKEVYRIIIVGDVNLDGEVSFKDIITANAIRITQDAKIPKEQLIASDINNTGKIEFRDIISINAIRINLTK